MDEATSNLDDESDKLIQKILREKFKDRTILTIAHRLQTIMDSDKILVLGRGKVLEFDTPKKLLCKDPTNDPSAVFADMHRQAMYELGMDANAGASADA